MVVLREARRSHPAHKRIGVRLRDLWRHKGAGNPQHETLSGQQKHRELW
jgi:hypothetical protein